MAKGLIGPENDISILLTKEELKSSKSKKLEGLLVSSKNPHIRLPFELGVSENGNSINGVSIDMENNPVKYKINIRPYIYDLLLEKEVLKLNCQRNYQRKTDSYDLKIKIE